MTIQDTYRASLVRRWHANPDMASVHDETGAHSGRVAMMLILLFPQSSKGAITYALAHDLGEIKTGDWPVEFKRDHPEVAVSEAKIGAGHIKDLGFTVDVTRTEIDRVKLCDRLDAYLTAKHHNPHLMDRDDWQADRRRLLAQAEQLGVRGRVEAAI